MPISFNCPHCGTSTQVADQYAGQSGPCKSCGNTVQIPYPTAYQGKPLPAPTRSSSSTGTIILVVALIAVIGTVTVGGVLVALLLPAVQAAREGARRMSCSNNLKQVAIAMHNYHDTYKAFPPAYTVDADGNKLHSWRTLLLPFIDNSPRYDQIDLDKPWDAPENQHIADTLVPAYTCPSSPDGMMPYTNYMVIVGPGAIFDDDKLCSFSDILDGSSNTILVVEVEGQQVPWMEPTDLSLDQMQMAINSRPTEPGSNHLGGFQAALADGSVHFIADSIDPTMLRNLITRGDGQTISGF
ncbi:MAG: DUF1559 domain-containing protein [Planctomycetota bacterium]|nr:DUF1559 domain-containing protein [Planctomycetota bacterium]